MKRSAQVGLRIFAISVIIVLLFNVLSVFVSAESMDGIPYTSYTYWEGYSQKTPVPTKPVYKPVKTISGYDIGCKDFVNLSQVFSDGNFLYIVDSGNSCILKLDSNYNLVDKIESLNYNGEQISLSSAKGIYVYGDEMFIADTDNSRVICCRGTEVFNIITQPQSTAIPKNFLYAPIRVIKDYNNYLYVLCDGSYYGMMVFSDKYEFCGFYGANTVTSNVFGAIKDFITSAFETEEKHNATVQSLPFQIMDMCLDSKGFICTVNSEDEGQIRRFGSDGSNIFVYSNQFDSSNADEFNFGDFPTGYIDTTSKYSSYIKQSFTAVGADKDGFIYGVDSTQGRIYMYDENCNLLTVFGGGVGAGNQLGTFVTANSVTSFGNDLLVSDFVTGRITVFRLTKYGTNLKKALILFNGGHYTESKEYWELINLEDKNCQLAYKGLAKAYLKEKDYDKAMKYAKSGLDRVTYAASYKYVRNNFISKNFFWISLIVVAAIGAAVWFLVVSKKREIVFVKNRKLNVALNTITHPLNSFGEIKNKNAGSLIIATVFLILFYATKVFSDLNGGFMFVIVNKSEFNAIYSLLGTVGVVLLWVVMNWIVCMLAEGKGSLKDVYCTSCYCLLPQIIYNIAFLVLSHTVIATSNSAFGILSTVCSIATAILILLAMTVIHEYSFFKAIGMAVISLIAMGIGAFVLFVVLTLGQDFVGFIVGIVKEVILR